MFSSFVSLSVDIIHKYGSHVHFYVLMIGINIHLSYSMKHGFIPSNK